MPAVSDRHGVHRAYGRRAVPGRARAVPLVAVLGVLAVAAALVGVLVFTVDDWPPRESGRGQAATADPRASGPGSEVASERAAAGPRGADATRWVQVLSRLDAVRGRAWALGRPGLLRRVYVDDAPPLRRDRAMVRAYLRRGLEVEGVSLTLTMVRVVDQLPRVVRLATIDELGPLVARGTGTGQALPDDRPTRHLIELRRERGRWQIASVQVR